MAMILEAPRAIAQRHAVTAAANRSGSPSDVQRAAAAARLSCVAISA